MPWTRRVPWTRVVWIFWIPERAGALDPGYRERADALKPAGALKPGYRERADALDPADTLKPTGVLDPADTLEPADALDPCGVDIPDTGNVRVPWNLDTRNVREPWILGFAGTPDYRKPPATAEKYNQQYIRGRQLKKKYDSEFAFRYKRRSLRMSQHNYGWSGTYFVTIRTAQHEPLLEIPELRTILRETWEALPQRFPGASLDEFVIMPDHIHLILSLEGNVENPAKLGDVVGTYKSITTVAWLRYIKAARMERSGILWQHNYYERVIRDSEELEKTRQYIRDNPIKQQNKTQNPTGTLEP